MRSNYRARHSEATDNIFNMIFNPIIYIDRWADAVDYGSIIDNMVVDSRIELDNRLLTSLNKIDYEQTSDYS